MSEIKVEIVNKNKIPFKTVTKNGALYCLAKINEEYMIKITNNTYSRVEVVCSVDGMNIFNAKPAKKTDRGYIIRVRDNLFLGGWRKSDSEVAKFVFSNPEESYSNKLNNSISNIGVIGVVAYREKKYIPVYRSSGAGGQHVNSTIRYKSTITRSLSATASIKRKKPDIGTAHGDRKESLVRKVSFTREVSPFFNLRIEYGSEQYMESKGIIFSKQNTDQNPWPGENNYCPDPK